MAALLRFSADLPNSRRSGDSTLPAVAVILGRSAPSICKQAAVVQPRIDRDDDAIG
jgi:hypothetical protein